MARGEVLRITSPLVLNYSKLAKLASMSLKWSQRNLRCSAKSTAV